MKHVVFTGKLHAKDKARVPEEFETDPACRVMIMSMMAGSESGSMSFRAYRLIFLLGVGPQPSPCQSSDSSRFAVEYWDRATGHCSSVPSRPEEQGTSCEGGGKGHN